MESVFVKTRKVLILFTITRKNTLNRRKLSSCFKITKEKGGKKKIDPVIQQKKNSKSEWFRELQTEKEKKNREKHLGRHFN